MINKISRFKILLLFIFIISLTCAQDEELISTPEGYYDLKRFKRFQHYKNIQPNEEAGYTDLYYPDVCKNAIRNRDGAPTFNQRSFPGYTGVFDTLLITKGIYHCKIHKNTSF
ncbi:hypothetical protein ACTFIT_007821 [Dictyostelium discoideum]